MQRPPAVSWEVAAGRWQSRLLIAWVLVAVLVVAGFLARQGWGKPSFVLLVALLGGILWLAMAWQNTARGQLGWDGGQWHWRSDTDSCTVRTMACVLDLQSMILLHIACDQGGSHWLWLESADKPALWKALRRAIVASATMSDDIRPERNEG